MIFVPSGMDLSADACTARSATEYASHVDIAHDVQSARFMHTNVADRKEWSVTGHRKDRARHGSGEPAVSSASELRHQQQALGKTIARRMDKLAKFLDEVCSGHCGDSRGADGVVSKCIDLASQPRMVPQQAEGQCGELRLVRLYYRHLIGSAMHALLRGDGEHPSYLEVRSDGKLDLVGFVCVLAPDQVFALLPKGQKPTEEWIRQIAFQAP